MKSLKAVASSRQNAKSVQAFADALKAANLPFTVSSQARPAESIPLDLLDKVAAMSEGQALLLAQPGGARAMVLTRAVAAPVSLEHARPAIEQFLLIDAKRRKVEADAKTLRAAATVKYVGKFAGPAASAVAGSTAAASQPAAPTLPSPAAVAQPAPAPATTSPIGTGVDLDSVRKGIKGLK